VRSLRVLRLKRRDYLVRARAIGPNAVAEDDARLGLRISAHSRTSLATAILRMSLAPMVDEAVEGVLENRASFVICDRRNRGRLISETQLVGPHFRGRLAVAIQAAPA